MKVPRSMASRGLGIAAILAAPFFVIFGWWILALAGLAAAVAAWIAPRPRKLGHSSTFRRAIDALRRRLYPHSWRPGGR